MPEEKSDFPGGWVIVTVHLFFPWYPSLKVALYRLYNESVIEGGF
jgi:hypothetical protein